MRRHGRRNLARTASEPEHGLLRQDAASLVQTDLARSQVAQLEEQGAEVEAVKLCFG